MKTGCTFSKLWHNPENTDDESISRLRNSSLRHFLFLQGPHGPFFARLGAALERSGAQVSRVGFNAGDQAFWPQKSSFIPFDRPVSQWPATLQDIITENGITDVVLYGEIRPIHANAIKITKAAKLRVHIFEEGYLRPYWVTYERDGSNGHSRLLEMSVSDMRAQLASPGMPQHPAPAVWGDMREHIFYGALYHWFVLFRNRRYRRVARHRSLPVSREAYFYTRRLLSMPITTLLRRAAHRRIMSRGYPYHLVLLQLEHDASFQAHGPFDRMEQFLQVVVDGFAAGAPPHHHLIFKAHPLEIGRLPMRKILRQMARERGIADRVHFVPGGKLGPLLDQARSAVTVNSTAAQQALWRGLPVRLFGQAVFDKPEFISVQPLQDFFAKPQRPDVQAYRDFRQYLLESCQIPGGFYSARGRKQLLRVVTDKMLDPAGPYDIPQRSQGQTHMRVVS